MKTKAILKNKYFLYLTEFFSGVSVMAVELGASRLIAPYFSSSQIVWTIIIGTIMIAMALGNLYGGKTADKDPSPDRLYRRILIAACWIAAIPLVGKYIILGVSGLLVFAVNSNFLIIAGFVSCMILFVFPLFLLGTVTPTLVKLSMDSLDDTGIIVGRLNAANTIGSIIGTFVPTFISIPAVGTAITFLIFAGILIAIAGTYFLSPKASGKGIKNMAVALVLFILCSIFGHKSSFAFWQDDLTYEGESVYNYLQVYEDDRSVALSTNVLFGVQSVYMKEKRLTGLYYDYAMAAPYMAGINKKGNLDILVLGNGSGTYVTQCNRYFDNVTFDCVEIDGKITELAHRYFEFPEDIKVTEYDGRAYLNVIDQKFDVIMVDAYQDITIPFQMSSVEFFTEVRDHLKDDGVMVVNMNMRGSGEGTINQYLSDTIATVFDEVYTAAVSGSTNSELFASMNPEMLEEFKSNVDAEENPELVNMMVKVRNGLTEYKKGDHLMTDDKAPVELLGMKVIDELIRYEVDYYKRIYKEKGIKGVLDALL